MKQQNEQDLSLKTKVLAVGAMALFGISIVVGAGGYTSYQREAKTEAVKTAAVQLANAEALKTTFPVFRETTKGKEIADMAIVKVNQSELPKTITAGLDESVDPNPVCQLGAPAVGEWSISAGGVTVSSLYDKRGFDVAADGLISLPSGAVAALYTVDYISNDSCTGDGHDGKKVYYYEFKITPPCPTGVTLTAN